jgi:trk system potassium uptake protein TrkH
MPGDKRADDDERFQETRKIAARIVEEAIRARAASLAPPGAAPGAPARPGAPPSSSGERAGAAPPEVHHPRLSRLARLHQRIDEARVLLRVRAEPVFRYLPPILAVAAAVTVLWKFLLTLGNVGRDVIFVSEQAIVIAFAVRIAGMLLLAAHPLAAARREPVAHALALAATAVFVLHALLDTLPPLASDPLFFWTASATKAYLIVVEVNELWIAGFSRFRISPSLTLALTFVAVIGAGTGLLLDKRATPPGKPIGVVDALFTATSAACVTGLTVRDTGSEFTRFGQYVILGLIQVGGLGIMTYAAFFAAIFGRGLSIRDKVLMRDMLQTEALDRLPVVLALIVVVTVVLEAGGAALLFRLDDTTGAGQEERGFAAVFHAVSAYCNAGFGLYSDSLARFERRPDVLGVYAVLIVAGGLGYVVVLDLIRKVPSALGALLRPFRRGGPRPRPFSLQTRLVLGVSAALLAAGMLLFLVYESRAGGVYERLPPEHKVANALFLSVSCRTAGFNVASIGAFSAGSLLVIMALMFIGGSPGSTAGGVKTTTFAVLAARVYGLLRRREEIEMAGRTIPRKLIANAIGVVFVQAGLIFAVALGVLYTDPRIPFDRTIFEVVSAFGTVGLSTGITADLSPAGRVLITLGMFVGRIGPLTLLLAMAEQPGAVPAYRYPEGRFMIG